MTLRYIGELTSLAYVSQETRPLNQAALGDILASSRRHNESNGITGLLVYANGRFVQVLEGSESVVNETMLRIKTDERHHRLHVILTQTIPERHFGIWSMAFPKIEELTEEFLARYSFPRAEHPWPQIGRSHILRLLFRFRETSGLL